MTTEMLWTLLDIPNLVGKAGIVAELQRRGVDRRVIHTRLGVAGRRSTDPQPVGPLPLRLCSCGFTH